MKPHKERIEKCERNSRRGFLKGSVGLVAAARWLPGRAASQQSAASRITVEQQIARNLTITYVSNVSSTQQQVIQVEYNVDRNVSIVGLRDQNGTFGIDIKIKKRFQ